MHLWRFRFHGDANWSPKTPEERYHSGYVKSGDNECWNWTKGITRDGYGKFMVYIHPKRHTWIASRYGWTIRFGEIPEGMIICHHCDNPLCQNPKHWFLGTPKDNMVDKMKKGRFKGNTYGYNGCRKDPITGKFIKR